MFRVIAGRQIRKNHRGHDQPLRERAPESPGPAGGCTGSCVRWPTGFRNVPAVLKNENNKTVKRGNRGVALYAGKENSVQESRVKTRYGTIWRGHYGWTKPRRMA